MAGGFWRGQAAGRNIFQADLNQYLQGLGGADFQNLLNMLTQSQAPLFEGIAGQYGHLAAGMGQVFPGSGASSAAQEGFGNLSQDYASKILSQALGMYQMPWQSRFGGITGIPQQYAGGQGGGLAGFAGQLFGAGMGGMSSGFGAGMGMKMAGGVGG